MTDLEKRVQALKRELLRPRELILRAMQASGCVTQAQASVKLGLTVPMFSVIMRGVVSPSMKQAEAMAARLLEEVSTDDTKSN